MPLDSVSFVHWAGWTGRAGSNGLAITFFTKDEIPLVRKMAELLKESKCSIPEWIFQLKKSSKN